MDLYEAIHHRRSHRLYKPDMPKREALERVVEAGLWAPSGMNTQCWDITVLAGKARDGLVDLINLSLKKLVPIMQQAGVTETSQQRVAAFFKDLGRAPVVIAVTIWKWDAPGAGNFQSGAALMQNMLLAAHAEGLGTCWMTAGSLVEKEVLEYLGKPNQSLLAITPIGYSAKEPPVPPRKERPVRWLGFE
ncbi:MAG: nitroreductase family protein [Deltaproteobacteria bacterium]|nr:nitroreductase family protein [Deltaproteobacteria bacterium]